MLECRNGCCFFIAIICIAIFGAACESQDDQSDKAHETDDDSALFADDDLNDDSNDDDDTHDPPDDDADDDTVDTFPPEGQMPLYEIGMILPPDSLECVPEVTGVPQFNCNHHGSAVAVLPDGTVAAVWYHGVAEKSPDSRLVWSRRAPDATEWTWPEVLYDDPHRAEGNPTLWVAEDGELLVFFVTIFGENWDDSAVRLIRSQDGGASWSDPVTLRDEWCWMTRHRPVRLADGDLLLPLYNECLAIPNFMRSSDNFTSAWTQESHVDLSYIIAHLGQIQPALIVLDDGSVAAITRDGFPTHHVKRMLSIDNGRTWTRSRMLALPNSGTSVDQVRLSDGHVAAVYNDSPDSRFPLTVALSRDGGSRYVKKRNINDECESGACSYAYPSIAQSPKDGAIWVTYTHDRRTIGWVRFNEAWLLRGN